MAEMKTEIETASKSDREQVAILVFEKFINSL